MNKRKANQLILFLLSAILGLVFMLSAYTKTIPISYFEYVVDSQLNLGSSYAAIGARILIGLEAALGLLLVLQIWGKKDWVPRFGLLLTLLFSIHLVVLWLTLGNDVNCGCMGNQVFMSPLTSLLKNTALIAGFILLISLKKRHKALSSIPPEDSGEETHRPSTHNWLALLITVLLIAVPFLLFPITQKTSLPLSRLLENVAPQGVAPRHLTGKHVVAFMSLGCSHCRDAAGIFSSLKHRYPQLPVHLIFSKGADSSRAEKLEEFMDATAATNLDYSFINKDDFIYFMQATRNNGVPIILWMQDSTVYRQVSVPELNDRELLQWLK